MSILSNLVSSYGDDIARAAGNKIDDVARIAANKADDVARIAANKADNAPSVLNSLFDGSGGREAGAVTRFGSQNVAPVNPETLPNGWNELGEFLSGKSPVEQAVGKSRSKITKQDLVNYLEDLGYDTDGSKSELWKGAEDAFYEDFVDQLYQNDAGKVADMLNTRRWNSDKLGNVQDMYLGTGGRTGRLDAELSDRLGIGRSNTPKLDRLNNIYGGAAGDYSSGAIGVSPTWTSGDDGVSTVAHERLHSFQNEARGWDYDEAVRQAYNELHDDLAPFIHDRDTIVERYGTGKADYWAEPNEQEARMFQNYLDAKNYTSRNVGASRANEWGDEINPAFDKFIDKLRELSSRGIALPAAAGLLGGGSILGALLGGKDNTQNRA